jgi:hypothetical protein
MEQLILGFLPMKKIKIEISKFVSNRLIFIPKPKSPEFIVDTSHDVEGDPFPLAISKGAALRQSYFVYKVFEKMDERIVRSGLKILQQRQQLTSEMERKLVKNERKLKAYQDKIDQKFDRILNRM